MIICIASAGNILACEGGSNNWHTITFNLMFLKSQKVQNSLAKTPEKWFIYVWMCVFPTFVDCTCHYLIVSNG